MLFYLHINLFIFNPTKLTPCSCDCACWLVGVADLLNRGSDFKGRGVRRLMSVAPPVSASSTQSSSLSESVALLVPKQLRRVLSRGGAEVVVEKRTAGKKRMFVNIPDEYDREEGCRRHASHADVHRRALEDLRWARETLWNDERLQPYLYTSDHLTWPPLTQLASMVNLAWSARETDAVPDHSAVSALKKALGIIRHELLYTGLHPLREEALAGQLLAFTSEDGNISASGSTLHAVGGSEARFGDTVWSLELHTPSFNIDDVLRLSLTARMQKACMDALPIGLAPATVGNTWSAVLAAHRQAEERSYPGLFHSVPHCITLFDAEAAHVARMVSEAAIQGRRVRLRVGVYLTMVQRNELYVLSGSSALGDATDDESELRTSFERATGRSYKVCQSSGLLLRIRGKEEIEDALRLRFLGPLASKHELLETATLTSRISSTHVVVKHNPFVVIHGPRVAEGFPENAAARSELLGLLSSRESTASSGPARLAVAEATPLTVHATSVTLTGEDLRQGVDDAVLKTLSSGPMPRSELAVHSNMARFRDAPNFEVMLKDSLKRIAEYHGRKYRLKE
ncbi:hypothetical protein, conserved [Trypanosoma brucei brucei TREU927]|uniref:Uncharacterized protein n=1 Tax=Trypanosoma brucei brucei (strain 927/4 GUTat10.1) TaxID=185431 RepID=Q387E6_TRYB2|nr:hypothetical protein, conserved [Trypanosoma brucei brucei TREU927]EAN79085.1 hypothetical protein, conserved [Trypanosoma brucei brucei TREU927]